MMLQAKWNLAAAKLDPSDAELAVVTAGDGDVFLLFRGSHLVALSAMTGKVVWQTSQYKYGNLALDGQTLFFSDAGSGSLTALRVRDGSQVWTTGQQSVSASLLAVGTRVYIEGFAGPEYGVCDSVCLQIDAYNAQAGALFWQSQDDLPFEGGPMVAAGNTICAFSGDMLVAVRASDGSPAWQYQPSYGGFLFIRPSSQGTLLTPSIVDGVLFLAVNGYESAYLSHKDAITAINAKTGGYYWTQLVVNQDLNWLGMSG
jgi:outer membrane protein assembly factor BamB